jgi:uncharacterized coiled-coil protein SlyX
MHDDSVAAVIDDYRKIAQNNDWRNEIFLAQKASSDYIDTLKSLVETTRYNRQASRMIEGLMAEVEDKKETIDELKETVGELEKVIDGLLTQIDALTDGNSSRKFVTLL